MHQVRVARSLSALLLPLSLAVAPLGCARKTADEPPPSDPTAQSSDGGGAPEDDGTEGKAEIDDEIAQLCDLEETRFDFNSAKLSKQAQSVLDQLATCFVSGPGAGQSMRLVGHADPRGDEEYNLGLGQRRADHVAKFLTKKGLQQSRMETMSRGELDATGTDDISWAADRKVDILLAH